MNTAQWMVPQEHPAFAGHFPSRPILPGVVLLDHVLALAGEMLALDPASLRLGNAKFLSPVAPGEVLVFSLQPGSGSSIRFDIRCAGRMVATGALAPRAENSA